jgi:transposase
MESQSKSYVAVDIAKKKLDVGSENKKSFEVPNDKAGIKKLINMLRKLPGAHVVCEATGGYERLLMEMLHEATIPVSLVSAARVRDFAKSDGIKAKTDPIDTQVILRFAQNKKPRPTPAPSANQKNLAALMDRREHLTEQIKREKTRLKNSPEIIHDSIREMINIVNEHIKRIERQIQDLVATDEPMSRACEVLQNVKGIGAVTVWSIIAYLPEIHRRSRNEVVALAGLAPFNRDSGQTKLKRSIFGGRSKIRRILFLATQSAASYNEVINPYVQGLIARGKPYKCAIVAAMRKMLIHIRSLLIKHEIKFA